MFGNILLLTGLFVVWCFFSKARGNVYFTNITRVGNNDIFTNEFCESCGRFGATNHTAGSCECGSDSLISDSVFVRSKRKCVSGIHLREAQCLYWDNFHDAVNVKVIDVKEVNSTFYKFYRNVYYTSCHLTSFIAFLDATGEWQPFNLSSDILEVLDEPHSRYSGIKITRQSPSLTNLSGHVMKLGLNCIEKDGNSVVKCLMFRIKGVLKFPLCNYTPPTTTLPLHNSAIRTSIVTTGSITPSTTTTTSSITITNSSITPSTTTITPSIIEPPPPDPDLGWIIAVIVIIGIVLFLALIGAFVFLFKHHYICKSRGGRDVAREFDNFAVINNPGQQTYRVQEEPLYIELPDVYPSNRQIAGNSVKKSEGKQTTEQLVLSNGYATDAPLPRPGPLPTRPDLEENRHMENSASPLYQNDGHEVNEQRDASMVLSNPVVQEALSRSLRPRSKSDDFGHLPPAREKRETESDHHHHDHHHLRDDTADGAEEDEDVDYRGLETEKRAKSMFICPSCNENSDYQRLSRPGHCLHERNSEGREKSASFYESLTPERGTRESFYESPSCDGEDEEKIGDQIPEYQTLEPEETESDEVLDEFVDHDYDVLEEPDTEPKPEPTNSDLDEDNNKIGDPLSTDEDSREPFEPPVILDKKDNPAYAVPWKKTITEKPDPVRSELDEDNNKTSDPRPADQNPEKPFEPPVLPKIDNNPLYAVPWKKNISEESGRKRSYSM